MSTILNAHGETRVNTTTADLQMVPAVTALADGGWVVTWDSEADKGIHQQRYGANGRPVGEEILVSTNIANAKAATSVAALSNGGWIVTWISFGQDGSAGGIYQQRFSADGTAAGGEVRVNTTTESGQQHPSVTALKGGGWVVTWESGQNGAPDIYQQRYDSAGTAIGGEARVNTTIADNQGEQSVTALADGGWLVTWRSDAPQVASIIHQQRFNANGTARDGEVQVNTTTKFHSDTFVTNLADGGWIVVWTPINTDGNDIYQQRYDAAGQKVGGETLVNTTTAGDQVEPQVASLSGGGWIVTWSSQEQHGIYQQRYDAAGQKVGGGARVNFATDSDDYAPQVTGLANGGWVVTWQGNDGPNDQYNAYQQIFSAAGDPISPTTPIRVGFSAQTVEEGASLASSAGTLSAAALATNDGFTYALIDDAGGRFRVENNQIKVANGVKLDYEQARSHQVKVQAKDALGATFEQWVQINVNDVRNENLTGTSGADMLKGGRYADTFKGQGGNDTIYGGLGNDRLYGGTGSGRDVFVFDTRPNKSSNVDKIYDFNPRYDSIQLDNAVFTKLGSGSAARPVKFKADMFVKGKTAQDREDRIVYDKDTGALYYDKDGTGAAAQVKIATLSKNLALTHNDFFVI
jgi:Ca2+-binding RTX toxin-like protein